MSMLGAEVLLLTNAAGGVSDRLSAGDLMVLEDHISCFVPSPLIGKNIDELGTRFPDMSSVYDKQLRERMLNVGKSIGVELKSGVYCQLTGPQYETPAEVRMVEKLGADAVGMSTAIEAMTAVHCGMRVCGVSCITNMAAGKSKTALSHEEVQQTADKTADSFKRLVKGFIKEL
jgi:purine-nucleoside phosphorylase